MFFVNFLIFILFSDIFDHAGVEIVGRANRDVASGPAPEYHGPQGANLTHRRTLERGYSVGGHREF